MAKAVFSLFILPMLSIEIMETGMLFLLFYCTSLLCEDNKIHVTHYRLMRDKGGSVGSVGRQCESKAVSPIFCETVGGTVTLSSTICNSVLSRVIHLAANSLDQTSSFSMAWDLSGMGKSGRMEE